MCGGRIQGLRRAWTHAVAASMSLGPFVADPDEDSDDVVARMLDLGVRHLPILDGEALVGIVSMRDLLLLEALRRWSPPAPAPVRPYPAPDIATSGFSGDGSGNHLNR